MNENKNLTCTEQEAEKVFLSAEEKVLLYYFRQFSEGTDTLQNK